MDRLGRKDAYKQSRNLISRVSLHMLVQSGSGGAHVRSLKANSMGKIFPIRPADGHPRRDSHIVPQDDTQQLIAQSRKLRETNRLLRAELKASITNLRRLAIEVTKHTADVQVLSDSTQDLIAAKLSKKEIDVLRLIANGYATKQIAAMMGITFKTAVSHRTRLMAKLNIHETASLTRYAIRIGLIDP